MFCRHLFRVKIPSLRQCVRVGAGVGPSPGTRHRKSYVREHGSAMMRARCERTYLIQCSSRANVLERFDFLMAQCAVREPHVKSLLNSPVITLNGSLRGLC